MAVKNLSKLFKRDLQKAQKQWSDKFVPKASTVVEFTLGGDAAYNDFPIATQKVVEAFAKQDAFPGDYDKVLKTINTSEKWKKAGQVVLKRYAKTKQIGAIKSLQPQPKGSKITQGIYINQTIGSVSGSMKLAIWLNSRDANSRINTIYDAFTKDVWKQWVKQNKAVKALVGISDPDQKFSRMSGQGSSRSMKPTTVIKTFRSSANREHSPDTTTASQGIRDLEEALGKSRPALSSKFNVKTWDIIQHIKENTNIDWELKQTKQGVGKYNATSVVKLSLGKNPNSLDSDLVKLMKQAEVSIRNQLEETTKGYMSNLDFEASTSMRKQIQVDAAMDIIRPLTKAGLPDMRFKLNKKGQFKPGTRKEKLQKSSGKSKVKTEGLNVSAAAMMVRQPAKEKKKESAQLSILRLQTLINKRLGAEVRRNMGRPALDNITGQFSDSAELTSIRETKAGLSGEYTYTRTGGGSSKNKGGVYETFEGTGKRRWPASYNPKPLIAMSIRNLALAYTKDKFVQLRRT